MSDNLYAQNDTSIQLKQFDVFINLNILCFYILFNDSEQWINTKRYGHCILHSNYKVHTYVLKFCGYWGHCQIVLQLLTKLCIMHHMLPAILLRLVLCSPLDTNYIFCKTETKNESIKIQVTPWNTISPYYCVAYKRDKGAYLECHIRNQEEKRGKQIS